jgi:hypothetical protein
LREYGHRDDQWQFAGIRDTTRDVRVELRQRGTSASRSQLVKVTGALSNVQVTALVQTFIDYAGRDHWRLNTNPLFYKAYIVGDEHRALIALDYQCGDWCGWGQSWVYTYEQGKWRVLYGLCAWNS